ncbi:MAG: hybrid sensor histidine kinase/response regulator [Chloroflexota bacterium]
MVSEKLKLTVEQKKYRILLIEDNPINIRMMEDILLRSGYHVDVASNGLEGLDMVTQYTPDLILLDVVMPGLSGFEVCKRLKADPQTSLIPIIFMTAETEMDSIVQGFELGAVDYIKKPIQFRETIARIQTHLTVQGLRTGLEKEIQERESLISDLSAFTHMVAHDLKNPVTNIIGFSEILLSDRHRLDEATLENTLALVRKSGVKMHQIIDGLLMLANVRFKEVEFSDTDPLVLIKEVQARLHTQIEESGFEISYPENWPVVIGHPHWVEEVLANFVSNAIKYGGTPPKAEISYKIEGDNLKVMVKDNGHGLALEDQSKLFKPFIRLHTSVDGHGLGLSITKRIIEKLNGRVGVESCVGKGTTFFFTLPLAN